MFSFFFFFFSSRRRHTRFSRDWSSDVCSSDLCPADDRASPGPRPEALDVVGFELVRPLGDADALPTRLGLDGPGRRPLATCGSVATAATITAAPAAALIVLMALRLRARRRTRANVPGGGDSGSTSALSQAS